MASPEKQYDKVADQTINTIDNTKKSYQEFMNSFDGQKIIEKYQEELDGFNKRTWEAVDKNCSYIRGEIDELSKEDYEKLISDFLKQEIGNINFSNEKDIYDSFVKFAKEAIKTGEEAKDGFTKVADAFDDNSIDDKIRQIQKPIKDSNTFIQNLDLKALNKQGIAAVVRIKDYVKNIEDHIKDAKSAIPKKYRIEIDSVVRQIKDGISDGQIKMAVLDHLAENQGEIREVGVLVEKYVSAVGDLEQVMQKRGIEFDDLIKMSGKEELTGYLKKKLTTSDKINILTKIPGLLDGSFDKDIFAEIDEGSTDLKTLGKDLGKIMGEKDYLNNLLVKNGFLEKGKTIQDLTDENKAKVIGMMKMRDNALYAKDNIFRNAQIAGAVHIAAKELGLKSVIISDNGIENTTTGIRLENGSYAIIDPKDGSMIIAKRRIDASAAYDRKQANVKLYHVVLDADMTENGESVKLIEMYRTPLQKELGKLYSANGELDATDFAIKAFGEKKDREEGFSVSASIGGTDGNGKVNNGKFDVGYNSEHFGVGIKAGKTTIGPDEIKYISGIIHAQMGEKSEFGQLFLDLKGTYSLVNDKEIYSLGVDVLYQRTILQNKYGYMNFITTGQATLTSDIAPTNLDGNKALGHVDGKASGATGFNARAKIFENGDTKVEVHGYYLKGADLWINPNAKSDKTDISKIIAHYNSTAYGIGGSIVSDKFSLSADYGVKNSIYGNEENINSKIKYGDFSVDFNYKEIKHKRAATETETSGKVSYQATENVEISAGVQKFNDKITKTIGFKYYTGSLVLGANVYNNKDGNKVNVSGEYKF